MGLAFKFQLFPPAEAIPKGAKATCFRAVLGPDNKYRRLAVC
jgi:hypothetical protein